MRNFTNARKKAIKQRKKPRKLSFNLLLRSRFNLAMFSRGLEAWCPNGLLLAFFNPYACPLVPKHSSWADPYRYDVRTPRRRHLGEYDASRYHRPSRLSRQSFLLRKSIGWGGGTFDGTSNKDYSTRGCRRHRLQQMLAEAFAQHRQIHPS